MTTINGLVIDLLQNILSRLPAFPFASADCVSCYWNDVCDRVLSRPKLSSACLSNASLQVAVEGVLNKVLSEPIRPQFAIASTSHLSDLQEITSKLSSKVPVIINHSCGIIGRDAITDEFKEVYYTRWKNGEKGIMLTVGFVPGLKVKSISFPRQIEDPKTFVIDQFVTDIWEFSTSVSGHRSPACIMIFSVVTSCERSMFPRICVGVTKRRIHSFGKEEAKWMTSLVFHRILPNFGGDEFLHVDGVGIKTGDTFRYYCADSNTARSSVSNLLRSFKQRSVNGSDNREVSGGLIFTSHLRHMPLLGRPNADSSAFLENFPGVTFGGTICPEEIGRGYLIAQ
ncbi:hypothetical protein L1987_48077 [Smallanthus sonchifolius]|uniref:Uncharacterized protein n=1 Tax=Smallanthus sonchifolius TaxID=185202 RepID=A0ACB9FSK1_9ASTR|nr:hypothetical protein L1987_48077 [Smallanthus sonchifolius]